jgi:hypothetical protein
MPEINPYVGEFEGRRSVPSMGGVGVRTPTFHAYYQESKFGIAVFQDSIIIRKIL